METTNSASIGGDDALYGGAGSDWAFGGAGDDLIDGGSGNLPENLQGDDYIWGMAGNDILIGGKDTDTLRGGAGPDKSILIFGAGVDKDAIKLRPGSLMLDLGDGDAIHIENFDQANPLGTQSFQSFQFADGTSLSWEQLLQRGFDIDGTAGDDNPLIGTGVADQIDGKGGNADNDYCYATRFFRWRNYGCFVITCFNASLMRVCQPRPCALKCSSTSASTRMVKVTFVLAALLPLGRPRTGFSSLNSASFSAYVSASAAIPALIAASSAAVGVMNLRLLNIAIHLSGISFTQTDNAAHSAAIDKHHAIHPLANRRITDHARLFIVHAGIGLGPQPLPFQLLRQGQRNAMFRQVGSIFGRIKSNVHGIDCMYTYFKVKAYFKGHDSERMGTVVALAPKPFLTTAVIDVGDPLGGHGVEDRLDGDGGGLLWRLRDTRKSYAKRYPAGRRWRHGAKELYAANDVQWRRAA